MRGVIHVCMWDVGCHVWMGDDYCDLSKCLVIVVGGWLLGRY